MRRQAGKTWLSLLFDLCHLLTLSIPSKSIDRCGFISIGNFDGPVRIAQALIRSITVKYLGIRSDARLRRNQPQTDGLVSRGGATARTRAKAGSLGKRLMSVKTNEFRTRAFAFALVVIGCTATCRPALAQYWGDSPSGAWGDRRSGGWGWDNGRSGGWGWDNRPPGGWGDRYPSNCNYRRSPNRDFFYPFSGERHNRPAPAADYSKAPPPRKLERPATSTVVVVGDSMADWLGYGLDEKYADQPEIGVERKIRATSGLVRYDAKNEALDWPQAAQDALSNEKPNAIVVMLGLNDRVPLREKAPAQQKRSGEPAQGENQSASQAPQDKTPSQAVSQQPVPSGPYDFHTDQWAALYVKRVDAMIAALKSKGVPVIWVGLPAIRGTKASSDISYLDELYRERAERAGIIYVDIWDGFVDEDGDFAMQGPDFEGQIRRLRTADGVYFTKAGAVKIASYVDRELQRVMPSSVAPVALPGPEAKPKSGAAGARPDVGPVLPLTANGSDRGSVLLGAGSPPTTSDPIAAKVLSRGESLAAPAGRADDFSWPRPGSDASARPEGSPEPVTVAPDTPEKQDTATKNNGKNQDDAKKDAKEKSASPVSARVGPHRYYNYYGGHRGHHYGWYHR